MPSFRFQSYAVLVIAGLSPIAAAWQSPYISGPRGPFLSRQLHKYKHHPYGLLQLIDRRGYFPYYILKIF